jgi:leucyl aminopeptidase
MEGNMKITVHKGELRNSRTRAAVVGHFEDSKALVGAAKTLDKSCNGLIGALLKDGTFEGKLFETAVVNTKGLIKPERVLVVGLGKKGDFDPEKLRGAYSKAAKTIRDLHIKEISTSLDFGKTKLPLDTVAEAAVEGVLLGLYQFTRFKTVDRDQIKTVDEFVIMETDNQSLKVIQTAAKTAESISTAVYYSRELVATPSNEMTPTIISNRARQVARKRDQSDRYG